MTKSEKKFVVAWTHAQARHFAQSMDWTRSEWDFANPRSPERLLGLYNIVLYEVRAPRYRPSIVEQRDMDYFWECVRPMMDSARIARHNVVNLP